MKLNLNEFIFIAKTVMEQLDVHSCDLEHSDLQICIYRDKLANLHLDIKGSK